jgi:hypothetical protein
LLDTFFLLKTLRAWKTYITYITYIDIDFIGVILCRLILATYTTYIATYTAPALRGWARRGGRAEREAATGAGTGV